MTHHWLVFMGCLGAWLLVAVVWSTRGNVVSPTTAHWAVPFQGTRNRIASAVAQRIPRLKAKEPKKPKQNGGAGEMSTLAVVACGALFFGAVAVVFGRRAWKRNKELKQQLYRDAMSARYSALQNDIDRHRQQTAPQRTRPLLRGASVRVADPQEGDSASDINRDLEAYRIRTLMEVVASTMAMQPLQVVSAVVEAVAALLQSVCQHPTALQPQQVSLSDEPMALAWHFNPVKQLLKELGFQASGDDMWLHFRGDGAALQSRVQMLVQGLQEIELRVAMQQAEHPIPSAAVHPSTSSLHPIDYCFQGSLHQVKSFAVVQRKWLLVNIIGATCAQSQRLNAETWPDEAVRAVVIPHFVFWQQHDASEYGAKFVGSYRLSAVPACAVLDPRTGEALCKWTGFVDAQEMRTRLTEFLAERVPWDAEGQVQGPDGGSAAPLPRPGHSEDGPQDAAPMMTEEEEIAHAIAASLEAAPAPSRAGPAALPAFAPSVDLGSVISDTPTDGAARVMLQLADAAAVRKHVKLDARTTALYDFVKVAVPEAQRRPFKLLYGFPPRAVPQGPDCTTESVGLQNEKIQMVWEQKGGP